MTWLMMSWDLYSVCVGETECFLNDTYENSKVVGIYIGDNRELRVLIKCGDVDMQPIENNDV